MRSFVNVMSSVLICGTGQMIKGHKKRGWSFLSIFVTLVCLTGILSATSEHPLVKVVVIGLGVVTLWVWFYNIIDVCTLPAIEPPVVISPEAEEQYRKGLALLIQNQKDAARQIFQELVDQNGRDVDSVYQLGKIAAEQQELKKARQYFDRCRELSGGGKWSDDIDASLAVLQEPVFVDEQSAREDVLGVQTANDEK